VEKLARSSPAAPAICFVLAEAAKLLNELSDEARQLHDSKELMAWIETEQKKAGAMVQQ
jgi:hypothetical protein